MTTADLAAWLLADDGPIAEDERVARATNAARLADGRWSMEQHTKPQPGCRCGSCYDPVEGVFAIHDIDALGDDISPILHEEDAAHIVAWDPARVLAECAAKRRRIELLIRIAGTQFGYDVEAAHRLIALEGEPYADRAGWRDEWAA